MLSFLLLGLAWFVVHTAAIVWVGIHDDVQPADVICVLGNKVLPSGVPSLRLQERLDRALALYREGKAPTIVVSGGLGREGVYEGDAMAAYLLARGVPPEAVLVDNQGIDTYHSAQYMSRLMVERGWRSCIVVSTYYHLARARLAFRHAGVPVVYTAHAQVVITPREPWQWLREFVGYYAYALRPY